MVGRGYHVTPLLPVLAADGAFRVLSLTAHQSRVPARVALRPGAPPGCRAADARHHRDRVGLREPSAGVPGGPAPHRVDQHRQRQVHGDTPADWRIQQLLDLARAIASAVDTLSRRQPLPTLVADAGLGGHFRRFTGLGPHLVDVVEGNPESLSDDDLHATAYRAVRPRLDRARQGDRRPLHRAGRPRRSARGRRPARPGPGRGAGPVDSLLLRFSPTIWVTTIRPPTRSLSTAPTRRTSMTFSVEPRGIPSASAVRCTSSTATTCPGSKWPVRSSASLRCRTPWPRNRHRNLAGHLRRGW